MITTRYALCGSRVIFDAAENRVSVIDLFEDLIARSFPIFIPRISFAWGLKREDGDPEQTQGHIILRLDNEEIAQFPVNINFEGTFVNRQIMNVGGVVVPHPGNLRVIFHAEHAQVDAFYDFKIISEPQVVPAQAAPPTG